MMSLIARVPSNISSSTSESPGKRSYGNQNPWSAKAERGNPLWAATQKPRLNRVNDQVWKRQKTIFHGCYRRRRKTFYDMGNVHVCNNGISSIHGKELPEQMSFHGEYKRPRTETSVRHIYKIGVWTRWDLCIGERIINLQHTKVYVFSDSVLCLGKIHENSQSNDACEQRLEWFKSTPEYRTLDRIDGEPMEFEWNFCPGFNTLQLSDEVKHLLFRIGETPKEFHKKDYLHVDVQRHFLWNTRQRKRMSGKR